MRSRRRLIRGLTAWLIAIGLVMAFAPAASKAQPPLGHREFVIYFEEEQADITKEAVAVLESAAEYFLAASDRTVELSGHTDTLGRRRYNLHLSRRRAKAARRALGGLGVPRGAIAMRWSGETMLPHSTPDETYEPLNRAVLIIIRSPG